MFISNHFSRKTKAENTRKINAMLTAMEPRLFF